MDTRTRTRNRHRAARTGAAMVECAFVLPMLLFVLFAMLDLGLAAVRYNTLAEASRRIAREAIIHGSLTHESVGVWGPSEYSGTAADSSVLVASLQNVLPTMTPNDVQVRITWPDGDNSPRDPVQVEVRYVHQPIVPTISLWGPLNLRSVATMHILN
jgi:hypothetical protein